MKILVIGPAHPYRGGIAALNERLAEQLTKEGHEVEIISFTLQYPGFLFPGKTQFTDGKAPDLNIRQMINSVNPFNWVSSGIKLRRRKADLIIVRYWLPFMGPSTGTVCKIAKSKSTKVIAITDNILPHEARPGDKLFTRYFCSAADAFVAMSKSVYDDLDLFIGKKPKKLTPHPIYDHYGELVQKQRAKEKLGLDPGCNYILFFGFIRDYKGLDLLMKAIALMDRKKLNVKLLVAGEYYSNEEKYLKLVEKLSIREDTVLRTDYIPEDKVNLYFCAADIIAQPYKTATQSGVTQIGYHFNKPMLVTRVGGLPEIIEDQKCGYVVDTNPEAISEALTNFYEKDRESDMIKGVVQAKVKFAWDKLTKTIFDLCS